MQPLLDNVRAGLGYLVVPLLVLAFGVSYVTFGFWPAVAIEAAAGLLLFLATREG